MKKLTKLVSAIAFASALALVGCANPSSGAPTLPKISVSDVQKPTGYNKASNPVKSAAEGNIVLEGVLLEAGSLPDVAFETISKTSEFQKANTPDKDATYKTPDDLYIAFYKAFDEKKDFPSSSFSGKMTPKEYTDKDNNILVNVLDAATTMTVSMKYNEQMLKEEFVSSSMESIKIKDASKMDIILYGQNGEVTKKPSFVKSMIMNENRKDSWSSTFEKQDFVDFFTEDKDGHPTTATMSNSNDQEMIVFFESGEKNGILHITGKLSVNDKSETPDISGSVKFYDIDGKESYTYTDEEAKPILIDCLGARF